MKPRAFQYERPVDDAAVFSIFAQHGDEARALAGGQSLVPMMNFRLVAPAVLVDLNGMPGWSGTRREGETLVIGAMTRHAQVEDSELTRLHCPLLQEAVGHIAHRTIRNRGTIGGSIALAYPGAELPLMLATLGGTVGVRSARGGRAIGASDFFRGMLDTALEPDELITELRFPIMPAAAGYGFVEMSRRHGDYAMAASAATLAFDAAGRVVSARLGLTGGLPHPVRAIAAEAALSGATPSAELFADLAQQAVAALDVDDDEHIPAGYRRQLLRTAMSRALSQATTRAQASHGH